MKFLKIEPPAGAAKAGRRQGVRRALGRGSRAAALVLLLVVGWMIRPLISGHGDRDGGAVKTVVVPAPPPPRVVYDTLVRGETLAEVMSDHGFTPVGAYDIIQQVRQYKNPRSFRVGTVMRFAGPPGTAPRRVAVRLSPDSLLRLTAGEEGWTARLDTVPITVDTLLLAGWIESSLWYAKLSGQLEKLHDGEFQEYVYDLADVFAWKVDFTRDIRAGDAFRVAIQRELRPDGSLRTRRFLAIELSNRGRLLTAIPFTRPNGRREYFDLDAQALRGVFLRYPVPYRITSGFSRRRYHPILRQRRAHLGIDYGAPYGTTVRATADGTVTRAGTWGGFGRMIEVRHARGIRTRYAHLSSISKGVRVGARVQQGQPIGRVGATGLATGPHLHYEFLQNGAHRNPSTVDLPSAPALEDAYREAFSEARDSALRVLDGVSLPSPTPPADLASSVAD